MVNEFPLDSESSNKLIAEITEVIKRYYPIGVNKYSPAYDEYPGIIKLKQFIGENTIQYKKTLKPWSSFLKTTKKDTGNEVYDTGLPTSISFSGEMIIEQNDYHPFKHAKKIVFSVSLIAPLFSIIGIDETLIIDQNDERWPRRSYRAINVFTASPYKEFEAGFNFLMKSMREQFPNHKFVPFYTTQCFVKGLQTLDSTLMECRVHNALFNQLFDFSSFLIYTRGDKFFGSEPSSIRVRLLPPPPIDQ